MEKETMEIQKRKSLKNKIKDYYNRLSKEEKNFVIIGSCILAVILALFVSKGLSKREDVILMDYSVYPNGSPINIEVSVASSKGYTRGYRTRERGDAKYITFYSTYGGIFIGKETSFDVKVGTKCKEIYFNRIDGDYELVLKKNEETGEWEKVTDIDKYQKN